MKYSKYLLIPGIFFFILFASCGGNKQDDNQNGSSLGSKIETAERNLNPEKPDPSQINNLLVMYTHYADSLPKDSLSPVYLMKAADLYHFQGKYVLKCQMYQRIIERYPSFRDLDMVMYLYAFSMDSELNQREKAKAQYLEYVEKFPQSQYIPDAKSRLETIDSLSFKELEDRITNELLKKAH